MASVYDVREEESLRVKIGEAKNLPGHAVSGAGRSTYCALKLDTEEIYRTRIKEKELNPFYGEEFSGEIPRRFRNLSCYVYEAGQKASKPIGKVCIKRQDLYKYHGKEHWFPLAHVDADSEVQGKVHLEIKYGHFVGSDTEPSQGLLVRVIECSDLTVINGACNPYAVVSLSYKCKSKDDVKRTNVRKKTICPQFDDTFFFMLDHKGNNNRNQYNIADISNASISVSLWHDDSRVSREVLGGMFPGSFLGEVKIPIKDVNSGQVHNAWYCLRSREGCKQPRHDLGSLRLNIHFTSECVFTSEYYDDLKKLLLYSPEVEPVSTSAAAILGEIVENMQDAARPLMKIFLQNNKLVPLISALAKAEMTKSYDLNTLFRGDSLITKLVDELMKYVALPYLHESIKPIIDQIYLEKLPCEIDPRRIKDSENLEENMANLRRYVEDIFQRITTSGLLCPLQMCEIFSMLKAAAQEHFPDSSEVTYLVVSGFIFLRFFAPAIMGLKFDLHQPVPDGQASRTLTLVSKAIQGLGNLVSSRSLSFGLKEEYMVPLFQSLNDDQHKHQIKMYLDIVSASTFVKTKGSRTEAPIVLKEGYLTKRAQGRKKFGVKNFKKRYFCLTNQSLQYRKSKDEPHLCDIPIGDILAVESLREESFKMKYMFQVIQPERALYVQASNCVEAKEWLDILNKVCNTNKNRLKTFHPAAFINGHWLCCKSTDQAEEGCSPVTGALPLHTIQVHVDESRELEKIHSLFLQYRVKLEDIQDACANQVVYTGEEQTSTMDIEDAQACFRTINSILTYVIRLEQEHMHYRKAKQRSTVMGSIDAPFGDDSFSPLPGNTKL